ncbi:cation channel sperm-associated protein subunit zeta [Dromiciops gliroides]|uniref:cation channel sperm-associated protein subunit zeta n=1 Tax=Dromiciops gliroides TaxID=33562 RepID=UPI001CC4C348|nr:cation channel sperm-associated protein subunit zeta [Dromiciops gliroides]
MFSEESPASRREARKLWATAGAAQRNQEGKWSRERDSSIDTSSSRVAPLNWRKQSTMTDGDSSDFSRAAVSATFEEPPSKPTLGKNVEDVDRSNPKRFPELDGEGYMGSRDATHRAYWAELQNRLPLSLVNLMEQEALEILTKSLHSYRKGIGQDHKLTQQLQRHVDQLRRNLKNRLVT